MLVFVGLLVGTHYHLSRLPDREARAPALAALRLTPAEISPDAAFPLRVAGAWRLESDEPRLGGVSALAIDRGGLVALTDSGVVIRMPKPGASGGRMLAEFRDLPSGPGSPRYKAGRDSEALARDAAGRGWWVGYENRHAALLFTGDFERVNQRIGLRHLGWRSNKGVEGVLSVPGALALFPESGDMIIRISESRTERIALPKPHRRLSDVTILPDGRTMVLARTFGPAGFSAWLLLLDGKRMAPVARLRLGRLDNPEAIAAEALPGGITRLWVMTDNDYRRRVPTLLIALDWAG